MWIFRLVVANLIAGTLRPFVWAALWVLAAIFVISVPARLWVLYVDSAATAATIHVLEWVTAIALASGWLLWKLRSTFWRVRNGHRRRGPAQRRV